MERKQFLCRSAEVNGTKTKSLRYGRVKWLKSKKEPSKEFSLLSSKVVSMGVLSDDFAAVDVREVLCYHSRPKKRKFRGADPSGQWCRRNLLQKIIRTSNRLLGSYYSGLVLVAGLEPARYFYRGILRLLCTT